MVDSVPDGSAAYISSGATASVSSGAGSVSAAVFNSAADVLDGAYVLADGEYDGKRYVAVVYSDMPLVTVKGLRELAAHMKKNGAAAVRIGRGVLIDRNRVQARSPILVKSAEYASVTDAAAYVAVYKEMRRRINERLIKSGVILLDGDADIDDTVKIAGGVRITGHVLIEGASVIGGGTTVGPGAVIRNSVIGGGCRIGDFVEIKASVFGDGVRAAHLAYIGDAEVGADTNVGCGAVFCNYDGVSKHKTVVGSGCFIGANVNLIAPVRVEDGCFIAAGTTVTENLKAGAFCIGRARQTVKERGKQKKTDG
jgi:bifunctional N-acetylglucosamine-1-phosphate-uridyltransferase/glucosamine-1-phosphate-acetyltransferase GlmU-like protein